MRIYMYQPLEFHFHSGITLGVINEYSQLSRLGHEIFLYGTYEDEEAFKVIQKKIAGLPIKLLVRRGPLARWRSVLKFLFLWSAIKDRAADKLFVTRHYNKATDLFWLKPLLGSACRFVYEAHEDAFPHLIAKKNVEKEQIDKIKTKTEEILRRIDGIMLTNFSQEELLEREFAQQPASIVLPNGVDSRRFSQAKPPPFNPDGPFIVGYTGQFTAWKNIELMFFALAKLDNRYHLRIAGGKGGKNGYEKSLAYVEELTNKHGLAGRVDFRGFVQPEKLVGEVLDGCSVMALPMGDNIRARYLTSPMKLFEAMATHIPVVAVDFPSVRLVTGDNTVFLADTSPESFAKAIEIATLAEERSTRVERMNAISRQYSHKARADAYHSWLRETIAPQKPPDIEA